LEVQRTGTRGEQLHAPLRLSGRPTDEHPNRSIRPDPRIQTTAGADAHAGRIDAARGIEGPTFVARNAQENRSMGFVIASGRRGRQRCVPYHPNRALAVGGHRRAAI
jgi:hypothetical protein